MPSGEVILLREKGINTIAFVQLLVAGGSVATSPITRHDNHIEILYNYKEVGYKTVRNLASARAQDAKLGETRTCVHPIADR